MPLKPAAPPAAGDAPSRVASAFSADHPGLVVIAHRGVFGPEPENSLAALDRAASLGATMMELDVQADGEGRLVILHDATLERTTNGRGPIAAASSADLMDLRLRQGQGGPDAPLTEERLPRLAEILEAARGRILLNIDTKHLRDLPAAMRLVAEMRMAGEVLVKAAVDPLADAFPVADLPGFGTVPFMPVFTLKEGQAEAQVKGIARLSPPAVECHFDSLDALREARAPLAAAGIRLWVNSLDVSHSLDFNDSRALRDPEAVWGTLLDIGVGAIQTDRAGDLIAFARNRQERGQP